MDWGFPLVCVGGPVSGLDAYTHLLRNFPPNLELTIAIANHLRTMATQLYQILSRHTGILVKHISEGFNIKPNCVFIILASRDLHVQDGEFRLNLISKPRGWPDVITVFLHSLAEHWQG
ncbi:chemotaxis protein CheB [Lichenicola cladoniae]|uniref:chemotaxis protein CheB n=1 Tax=Lichenicola cladoniae TaxID=1484109 RepID=UPI003083EE74